MGLYFKAYAADYKSDHVMKLVFGVCDQPARLHRLAKILTKDFKFFFSCLTLNSIGYF